jgi:hypothetical protein
MWSRHHPSPGGPSRQKTTGLSLARAAMMLLSGSLALQADSAEVAPAATSGLNRLAAALGQAPDTVRTGFAEAALSEMAAIHITEADRARAEARHSTRDRDLVQWASAAAAYARELQALAGSLATATAIEVGVGIGPEDVVYLSIDGRPVMVTSPRPRHQASFEQRVIEHFCSQYHCDEYLAHYQPPPALLQPVASQPRWSFSQNTGPACSTEDGLVFQFQNATDLERKRRACSQFATELNVLAARLALETAQGTRIDWNRLDIHAAPDGEHNLVTLNGDGDTAMLTLPALAGASTLFRQLRPWLAARMEGNSYRLVLINSERLMVPSMQGLNDQDVYRCPGHSGVGTQQYCQD